MATTRKPSGGRSGNTGARGGMADSLASLLEASPIAVIGLDAQTKVIRWGGAAEQMFGWSESEVLGRPIPIVPPDRRNELEDGMRRVLAGEIVTRETRRCHKDGRLLDVAVCGKALTDGRGHPYGAIGLVQDISDRRLAEERQRFVEEHYRLLFDLNPLPMWVYDRATLRFLAVNDAAVEQYGYTRTELLEMTIKDIRPPEDVAALVENSRQPTGGDRNAGRWRHRKKNGALIDVSIRAADFEFAGWPARLVLAEDVTSQSRLEERLRHTQKMDALGRLSAGVAHDFNNVLAIVTGYAEHLMRRAPDEPSRVRLDGIMRAAQRGAAITRELLMFSRREQVRPQVIDLNGVLKDFEPRLRRLLSRNVELTVVQGQHLGRTRIDPAHLEQIVMNLAVNARDAMPRGGRLRLETSNAAVDQAYAAVHPDLAPGQYVCFAVSDSGHGMSEEIQEKIFEPFFTTKERAAGTGLGLAIAYGIVKQAGGRISVYSEVGRGTTFRILLPRVDAVEPAVEEPAAELPRGSGTILLVEDDDDVREITRENLLDYGYTVLDASDEREAIELASSAASVDLLLSDLVLGKGGSGYALARRLLKANPRLRLMFMSGYADPALFETKRWLRRKAVVLTKPITLATLLRKVREVLDAAPAED